jgi:hypothetical protein
MSWFKKIFRKNKSVEEKRKDYVAEPEERSELYYPEAHIPDFKMPTRGTYAKGHPEGAIVHFTAGRSKGGLTKALGTAKGGVENGFCFFVIGNDGSVVQSFPINKWGYHAGKSSAKGISGTVSDELVGIEVCCAGKLKVTEDGKFVSWFGEEYSASEVRYNDGHFGPDKGWYHKYTEAQEASLIKLIMWLKHNNPEVFKLDLVLGHHEIATPPGRKNDPEASLSMNMLEFRALLKKEYNK